MRVERRRYSRYCVRDPAFAVFNPDPVKLAQIIDISLGGLGISVSGSTEQLIESARLEILVDDCSFYLTNLSYKFFPVFRNLHWNSATSLQNRYYGVKFIDLMPSQKTQLSNFIRKHTIGGKTPQFLRKFNQFFQQSIGKKQFGESCQNLWLHRRTL